MTIHTTKPDPETVSLLKKGDPRAFDAIYRFYARKMYVFIFRMVKKRVYTEELVQEVFLKIWESRSRIGDPAKFDSWMFTIAYNSAVSLIRRKITENKYLEYVRAVQKDNSTDEPADKTGLDLRFVHLEDVIDLLPGRQQEVLRMHRYEGLSYRQIAERLQISKNTVENHMSRAMKFLSGKLGKGSRDVFFMFSCLVF